MKNTKILIIVLILLIAGLFLLKQSKNFSNELVSLPKSIISKDVDSVTVIAQNLDTPWGLVFLPDKSILFTERKGDLRLIESNGNVVEKPVYTFPRSREIGEGGLLGITLHPDFNTNRYVYFYYTYEINGVDTKNRVVRAKYENGKLGNEENVVENIPGAQNHDGGRIKFGPDGYLYVGTGDAQESSLAQNKNSLAGKILRVTDIGESAPGNPFNNQVYSYGHRNVQGLAWDAQGNLWATEHGRSSPTGYDELNQIKIGGNYGWPIIQGDEVRTGMITPIMNSGSETTWAPSGIAFLNNSLFFGGLRGNALFEAKILNDKVSEFKEHFKSEYGRIRDVVVDSDNMLYITTSNLDGRGNPASSDDRIIRINPLKL